MKMLGRLVILLFALVILMGCAQTPRKTAFNNGVYKFTDLVTMNPANVRVAVRLDSRAAVKKGQFFIGALLLSKQWPWARFTAPLKVVRKGRQVLPGTAPAPKGETWYLMEPTAEGITGLQRAQDEIKFHQGRYDEFRVTVMFRKFEHLPQGLEEHFPVKILLRFPPRKNFRTVFDGYRNLQREQNKDLAVWNHAF